jgi:hypothetical protein
MATMQSILENVPCELENSVYSDVGWAITKMPINQFDGDCCARHLYPYFLPTWSVTEDRGWNVNHSTSLVHFSFQLYHAFALTF